MTSDFTYTDLRTPLRRAADDIVHRLEALKDQNGLLTGEADRLTRELPEGSYWRQVWQQELHVARGHEQRRLAAEFKPVLVAARDKAMSATKHANTLAANRRAARALGVKTGPTAGEVRQAEAEAKAARAKFKELDADKPTPPGMITPNQYYFGTEDPW